ncbi:type II secretion system F family protein [Kocuria palustris]|uniref:type II secretion system F family protein n=1 Tax=Kocuria palustris TaxID=71999 RepID=UPI002044A37A|nr:type II secretion system F family protein [Kocuria palustris]MCM3331057.1 type II secretion system F family protein [Kocuria palustris]
MTDPQTLRGAALIAFLVLGALIVSGIAPLPGRSRPSSGLPGASRVAAAAEAEAPVGTEAAAGVSAGVLIELVASMLESGVPVSRALEVLAGTDSGAVGQALRCVATALGLGLSWQQAWSAAGEVPPQVQDLRSALTFAAVSGAPSASALRAASAQVRRSEHRRAEAAAERLSVHLMVPLGLCSLPAFVCWGIVPVLIGLVPDLLG